MWRPHSTHAHSIVSSTHLTCTVKSSLFTRAHSSPLSLVARLHQCHTSSSHHINNGWTYSCCSVYIPLGMSPLKTSQVVPSAYQLHCFSYSPYFSQWHHPSPKLELSAPSCITSPEGTGDSSSDLPSGLIPLSLPSRSPYSVSYLSSSASHSSIVYEFTA